MIFEYIGTYLESDKRLRFSDETPRYICSKTEKDYILYTVNKLTKDNSPEVIANHLAVKVENINESDDDECLWEYDLFRYVEIAKTLIELKDKADIIVDDINLNRFKYVKLI